MHHVRRPVQEFVRLDQRQTEKQVVGQNPGAEHFLFHHFLLGHTRFGLSVNRLQQVVVAQEHQHAHHFFAGELHAERFQFGEEIIQLHVGGKRRDDMVVFLAEPIINIAHRVI